MSSVAYTKTSFTPGTGAQGTMTSAMTNGHAPGGSSGTGKAPYRHIDDLVSVGVDLDPHTPLRKVLELGDAHMRQAMTYNDFRRPDLALQEYIKAFTIAVDKVPRHKDYPSLKSDPGHLSRLYNALKTKITANGAIFDKIKEDIKEDNRRSGVEPTVSSKISTELTRPISSNAPSGMLPQGHVNGSTNIRRNGFRNELETSSRHGSTNDSSANSKAEHKSKPPVQPKPQALHGNAINQVPKASPEDLASRFARLRESQKSGNPPKLPSVDTSMPAMPKLPEAIYSPARGTVTSEIANLPSSTPRGMFSRTNSITSTPSISARNSTENAIMAFSREQFATAQTFHTSQSSAKAPQVRIPQGETISAATLANLMHQDIEILIIDVRDRQFFDEGHIRSRRTICVEPEILMRENISADEIADSMVLAPSNEKLAIEQRDKADLVVIYDEDSVSVPNRITGDSTEMVLHNLRQALSHYSYSRPLKNSPKLLRGGLASWLNEFGDISLETSNTTSKHTPLSATSAARSRGGRRYRTKTKTLTQDEINQFEGMIQEDKTGISEFDYIKNRDDFIRRYPSIGGAPESMTTPINQELHKQQQELLSGIAPAPPRRPAPAIPRTRYSGLDSRDNDSDVGALAMLANPISLKNSVGTAPRTGLASGGNACYCNSTMQALLHSPGFIDEILDPNWPEVWRGPEDHEPTQPQLLSKILKNLFEWMHKRQFKVMRCTTLMHYMRSIHQGYQDHDGRRLKLGDDNQHDVDELCTFLFDQLSAETNVTSQSLEAPPKIPAGVPSLVRVAIERIWDFLMSNKKITFIDKHFLYSTVVQRRCSKCRDTLVYADSTTTTYLTPTRSSRRGRLRLEDIMMENSVEHNAQGICSRCKAEDAATFRYRFITFPPLLRIYIRRYRGSATDAKELIPIEFPFNLDLAPYSWDSQIRGQAAEIMPSPYDQNFLAPSEYELYSIQCHAGASVVSGHYWALIRTEQEDRWIQFNDDKVNYLSGSEWRDALKEMYDCDNTVTPVQLMYKRKDIPYEWQRRG
ncbi:cysteine proteinase [Annulohypoxylon truncatum]|uniref:cysteine proteinase n=1 Tax=Annulohypoxylon truncatum TaxID=327061 RepID=UPI002008D9AE|nr:cysteine proteinase [Annulohypoxylon truncatum]KAI1211379.1 cysteine proteinase [Annulohypoxylon truncatum]